MPETPLPNPSPEDTPPSSSTSPKASETALWKRIATEMQYELSLLRNQREDDDVDTEANGIATGLIILGLIILAFFLIRPLFKPKPMDPAYSKLEAIKRIQHLTLVRQHYETLIPVVQKDKPDVLEFMLKAPVEVSGFINLSETEFTVLPDSLILVTLPPAEIDTPHLDWDAVQVSTVRKSFWKRLKDRWSAQPYEDAYDQIRGATQKARRQVYQRAEINGIRPETENKAKQYLLNLITSMGYRVRFTPTLPKPALGDSTRRSAIGSAIQGMLDKVQNQDTDTP